MGTNYYLRKGVCEHCNQFTEEIHIGKSSCGWKFLFSTDLGASKEEVFDAMLDSNLPIYNEYGDKVTSSHLINLIISKQEDKSHTKTNPNYYLEDGEGFDFSEREFS